MKFNFANHKLGGKSKKKTLVICFDGYGLHGGLVDRLKGIISGFHLAKLNEYAFKIYFTHPFALSQYMVPGKYQWVAEGDDIQWNFFNSSFIYARDHKENIPGVLRAIKKNKNKIFLYTNLDLLDALYPKNYDHDKLWADTFKELFSMSSVLKAEIDKIKENLLIHSEAVGFHTRFTTLLGDFEDVTERSVMTGEQQAFMQQVWSKMLMTAHKDKLIQVVVFSDSVKFLEFVKSASIAETGFDIKVVPGKPEHSDRAGSSADSHLKSFVDFFLLSEMKKVILFKTGQMYASAFSRYAAILHATTFELIEF